MIASNHLLLRPSGARTFLGSMFLKVGPDSYREAQLLTQARSFCPEVILGTTDTLIMEPLHEVPGDKIRAHARQLECLHNSGLNNPSWRLCSFEDYRAYCLYPRTPRAPSYLYDIIRNYTLVGSSDPVFVHGDATLSNSLLTESGIKFIDLSVRPTYGDPVQDWSKMFFSCYLGFDAEGGLGLEEFRPWVDKDGFIVDSGFAFHLSCNVVRVLRKEPLAEPLLAHLQRSLSCISST